MPCGKWRRPPTNSHRSARFLAVPRPPTPTIALELLRKSSLIRPWSRGVSSSARIRPPKTTTRSCESSCVGVNPSACRSMTCSAKPCALVEAKKYELPRKGAGLLERTVAPTLTVHPLMLDSNPGFVSRLAYEAGTPWSVSGSPLSTVGLEKRWPATRSKMR